MWHLRALADDRLLGLDEGADVRPAAELRARAQVAERPDGGVRADHCQFGVCAQHAGILAHFAVDQGGVRADDGPP